MTTGPDVDASGHVDMRTDWERTWDSRHPVPGTCPSCGVPTPDPVDPAHRALWDD